MKQDQRAQIYLEIFLKQLVDFLEVDNLINKKLSIFIFVTLALVLGSFASSNTTDDIWYKGLEKSSLNPPGYVFGIVWPILYLFMSIAAYRVYESISKIFFVQLFFNTIWSWLFFAFHLPLIALFDILILIFLNIRILFLLNKEDKLSTFLYLPYLIWLIFASYLNLYIVINN